MALNLFSRRQNGRNKEKASPPPKARHQEPYVPADILALDSDPLKQCLQLERYARILADCDQWQDHPQLSTIRQSASQKLDEQFALVPEGYAALAQTVNDYPGCPETDIQTEPFLLARCAVTNAQFQKFVDADGYANLDLWPKDIWPHLIDFKDRTEHPGPRFWEHGRHEKGLIDHPVVGVCYFEAAAYAQWAGVRLPTEAQWQMAASWRIRSIAHVLRRYPWGDALDIKRCNIWASNIGRTVSVNEYPAGAAPNGVMQLVGNVWEWTDADFSVVDSAGRPVVGDMLMKSIRGGAFDTYFPSQATSLFRTGLGVLFRVHNVGFRCALDVDKQDSDNNN
ncbi:MAG: formylglycine-generating enzyme family protein [Phycisphaerae bacterium]